MRSGAIPLGQGQAALGGAEAEGAQAERKRDSKASSWTTQDVGSRYGILG